MTEQSALLPEVINWISENEWKTILLLLFAGSITPALAMLLAAVLSLPGVKQSVGVPCFLAGKTVSITLTKWLGNKGETLETAVQGFIIYVVNEFMRGLDSDDTIKLIEKDTNENT